MGTIFKKGKNWYIDFYHKGKRLRRKVGPSKELSRLALKDVELRIAKGQWPGIVEEKRIRFKDYARAWLKEHAVRLKPSTKAEWDSTFILPYFGDFYLAQIEEADIERFIGSLVHLSPKRVITSWSRSKSSSGLRDAATM